MPVFIEVSQVNDGRIFLNADMITMFAEEGNGNASILLKNGRVIYTENNYDSIRDSYESMFGDEDEDY